MANDVCNPGPTIGPGYRIRVAARKPTERDREDGYDDHGQPKHRHGTQGEHHGKLTETTATAPTGPGPEEAPDQSSDGERRDHQQSRPHEAVCEHLENKPPAAVAKRRAEITAHKVAEIAEVLRKQRFVEAVRTAQFRDPLRSHLPHRITRNQRQRIPREGSWQEEVDRNRHEQREYVLAHSLSRSGRFHGANNAVSFSKSNGRMALQYFPGLLPGGYGRVADLCATDTSPSAKSRSATRCRRLRSKMEGVKPTSRIRSFQYKSSTSSRAQGMRGPVGLQIEVGKVKLGSTPTGHIPINQGRPTRRRSLQSDIGRMNVEVEDCVETGQRRHVFEGPASQRCESG